MPRFVKWSKSKKTQEFWTLQLFPTFLLIQQGQVRSGQSKGSTQKFDSLEAARAAYDAELAKKSKAKAWMRVEVPAIPTTIGEVVKYTCALHGWHLEVRDETSLVTTNLREGTPAGSTVWQCASTLERDTTAELRIAEKLARGFVIEGSGATSAFTYTGYFDEASLAAATKG